MNQHEAASRPVLFFTEDSEYPYWGKGSSLLIAGAHNVYWLTANHVMERQRASPYQLMITPTDKSSTSVPFEELIRIERDPKNPDFKDLFMLKVNLKEFDESADSELTAWHVDRFFDCSKLAVSEELFVLGFPSESRFVNYDTKRIHFGQVVLRGLYEGPSIEDHCHKLRIETSVSLEDFDGLSGGAVFKHPLNPSEPTQLVGLLLRGSVESRIVHFLDAGVIDEFVHLAEAD